MNMTQSNVMADDAIMTPPAAARATAAPNQSADNSDLQWRMGVLEQFQNISDQPPQLPDVVEEIKKARAEKRLDASLRRMEIEQKARLLAETQQRMEQARRIFESRGVAKHGEMAGFASTIDDIFREQKAREELLAMEREQKEELLANTLESLGREFGDNWQQILRNSETSRQPGGGPSHEA